MSIKIPYLDLDGSVPYYLLIVKIFFVNVLHSTDIAISVLHV